MSGRPILTAALERQVVDQLRRRTPGRGHAKRVAFEAGVSVSHVLRVLKGHDRPGLKLAIGLGLVRLEEAAAGTARTDDSGQDEAWRRDQLSLGLEA
ncbi:MAG TPA: hypothetical protein VN231_05985 [Allosphingosinicella sp.]|nr:hypothetical protein [Allosphingosinicella sp.]